MMDSVGHILTRLATHLPVDTPAGYASEKGAEDQAVDAAFALVNAHPLEWRPAAHSFQLALGETGAPIGDGRIATDIGEADAAGRRRVASAGDA